MKSRRSTTLQRRFVALAAVGALLGGSLAVGDIALRAESAHAAPSCTTEDLYGYGGQDAADTLWDAATAKVVLPGGGDPRALQDMSNLIGEIWVERESHSIGGGPGTVQVSAEKRSIFDSSEIRTLESGYAFLFYRNLRPVLPKCRPFSDRTDFAACQADAENLEHASQQASPYAAQIEEFQSRHHA